jgi:hypothetical protein
MSARFSIVSCIILATIAGPAPAQAPSQLDLVRGLREAGMPDLALEYLHEIEKKPMAPNDQKAIPLEKAKCQLDVAEEEPDEGTRTSMVAEAKEAFHEFLNKNPTHPRASEAALSLARLSSIEAKAQLNKARRMEVGDDDELKKQQKKEAAEAQPMFLNASKMFAAAAAQIKEKLNDPSLDAFTKQTLSREAFDADLAAAINQYYLADTFVASNADDTLKRTKFLEEARDAFGKLARGPESSRTVWIARAWMAETLMDQGKPNDGADEFKYILAAPHIEAEEGKRLVRFFQVRRNYIGTLTDRNKDKLAASEKELRAWLTKYGNNRKPTPETFAIRFYLAFTLQMEADHYKTIKSGEAPARQLQEAEKLYRALSQTDNDYTARANRNRMYVVRRTLAEADKHATEYRTFEESQMAALIQMSKLADAEKALPAAAAAVSKPAEEGKALAAISAELKKRKLEHEIKDRKVRIVTLLERARELATDKDSPADVTDNLLRLVYFYRLTNQPYEAAVLGEHIARTVKSAGGKAATAGLISLDGYTTAASKLKVGDTTDPDKLKALQEAAEAARKCDHEKAVVMARYLDEKFPNDTATDAARHRLAVLLVGDKKLDQAFDIITRIRSGYSQLNAARLYEGYIAQTLITSRATDMPMPPGGKLAVYRKAIADLDRAIKPVPTAKVDDVRGYLEVRSRLAMLYLNQSRVDPETEAVEDRKGYNRVVALGDEILELVPTYDALKTKEPDKLNPPGMEMLNSVGLEMAYLGLDARTRGIYLRGRSAVEAKDLEKASAALEPIITEVDKVGAMFNERMKKWKAGSGDEGDDEAVGAQKARVAQIAMNIDQIRSEIVIVGFKLRVREGKPEQAAAMLDLLEKAGGSIEKSRETLELMARDLAAQIGALKKAKADAEAKALGEGLAILLKRLSALPNQSATANLFLGQMLLAVDQFDDALKELQKVPVPVAPTPPGGDWSKIDPNKLENGPDKKKFQEQVRDYRLAQLFIARAFRGSKKLPEAEKLLTVAIGTPDKPGYASGSLDFRRENALVHEAKGATLNGKEASNEWGLALKEWTFLFNVAKSQLQKADKATPDQIRTYKNAFFDAYYEIQRCLLAANSQLLKANPAKLGQTFTDVGKRMLELENTNKLAESEKAGNGLMTVEVWTHYNEMLEHNPELKKAYSAAGGKFFLEKPRE